MGIGSRLKEIIDSKDTNVNQLAKDTNISPMTIYSIIKRDNTKVDIEILLKLCKSLNISVEEIYKPNFKSDIQSELFDETLTDDEADLIEKYRALDKHGVKVIDYVLNEEYERCTSETSRNVTTILINYIDAPVSAGLGDILNAYEDTRKVSVPLTKESRKADFILKVDGDSMEPEFRSGDHVLVRQQPAIDEGQIGIFDVDGKGYIKKLGKNRLISLNPNYSDIVLNEYTDARCFGLVLGTTDIVDI